MSPTQKGSGYLTEEGVSFFYSIQSCWKSTQVVWRMLYISSFILNRITDSGGEGYGVKRVWRALGILNQNVDQSSFRLCEFSFPSPSQTLTEFHRILASKYFPLLLILQFRKQIRVFFWIVFVIQTSILCIVLTCIPNRKKAVFCTKQCLHVTIWTCVLHMRTMKLTSFACIVIEKFPC